MNRPIKFRAWDKKNGYYADYEDIEEEITAQATDGWRSEDGGTSFNLDYGIKDFELEQYTGLKDKNGKEIYEGDIVSVHHSDMLHDHNKFFGDNALVKCSLSKGGAFIIRNWYGERILDWDIPLRFIEVIGNIHENPELLEDK